MQPDWNAIINACNLWRNYGDIQDSWPSVLDIMNYWAQNQEEIVPNAGPGHWNDPDMVGHSFSELVKSIHLLPFSCLLETLA